MTTDLMTPHLTRKHIIVFLLVIHSLRALSQDTSEWLSIDCGSTTSSVTAYGILWETDARYIQTGTNQQVSREFYTGWEQMESLRVFTRQNKNCYTLPTTKMTRYFIRASFFYGDYDGLRRPPTFDLEIDGNRLTSIEITSLALVFQYEVIYTSRRDNISVCLDRTQADQYPFISALEAWPLPETMYSGMNRDLAWLNSYRYNYGAEDLIYGYPEDRYNRVWTPYSSPSVVNVTADETSLDYTTYEDPPRSAILDAVEATSSAESISLTFEASGLNFVWVYYTEVEEQINKTRSFDIYVDNLFVLQDVPEYRNCTGAKTAAQPQGTLTVELRPTKESTLPPIIGAIEVYTASDPLVTTGTSQEDLDGLVILIRTFEQLHGWSGEPCLPANMVWEWLKCAGNDPPRVTTLNLSGHGLNGSLPDFSQMQALEYTDLSNNSLDGLIPEFLGHLPNLTLLDLRGNEFSGQIPYSITHNKKIKYMINGNPNLIHHGGKKWGLIIGLAVGIPIGIIFIIVLLIYFIWRRQTPPGQGQVTTPETNGQGETGGIEGKSQELNFPENFSENASTEAVSIASQFETHHKPTQEENIGAALSNVNQPAALNNVNQPSPDNTSMSGETFQMSVNEGVSSDQTFMVPEMDMEELDELIQRHHSVVPGGSTSSMVQEGNSG